MITGHLSRNNHKLVTLKASFELEKTILGGECIFSACNIIVRGKSVLPYMKRKVIPLIN